MMTASLVLAVLAFLSISAQAAADIDRLVALFKDVCMGERPAWETIDEVAHLRGWVPDKAMSGERSALPTQSIVAHVWIVSPGDMPSGLPSVEAGVTRISQPGAASPVAETCDVLWRGRERASVAEQLKAELHLPEPTYRHESETEATVQWKISTDPLDGVVTGEGRLRFGWSVTITRVRMTRTP